MQFDFSVLKIDAAAIRIYGEPSNNRSGATAGAVTELRSLRACEGVTVLNPDSICVLSVTHATLPPAVLATSADKPADIARPYPRFLAGEALEFGRVEWWRYERHLDSMAAND